MKRKNKLLNYLIILSVIFMNVTVPKIRAVDSESGVDAVLYENNFNTGTAEDLSEFGCDDFYFPGYTEEFAASVNNREYASADAPAFSYVFQNIQKVELNNEIGIRTPVGTGGGSIPLFLFDFRYKDGAKTPSSTPDGISTGKYTLSFNFSINGTEPWDSDGMALIMANCCHGNTANTFVGFDAETFSAYAASNSWTYISEETKKMPLYPQKAYKYELVMDFTNNEIRHYIDGELKAKLTNYTTPIKYLMLLPNGDIDYFDNLKLTKDISYPIEYTVYENTFDSGSAADLKEYECEEMYFPGYTQEFASAVNNREYASENAPNYSYSLESLTAVSRGTNKGVRFVNQNMHDATIPIALFDFRYKDKNKTPSLTPDGLNTGVYSLSFDFSTKSAQNDVPYSSARIMANCSHVNTANYYAGFDSGNVRIINGYLNYGVLTNIEVSGAKYYNYKIVFNFDEHKVEHYLNDELKATQENFNTQIKFLSVTLNGDIDYFDNLKLTRKINNPIEYDVTSGKIGNNFYGDEPMRFTVTAKNTGYFDCRENVSVSITDPDGTNERILDTRKISIPARSTVSFELTPNLPEYAAYLLKTQSERSRQFSTRIARIVKVDALNEDIGTCAHFDARHPDLSIENAFELMERAGISAVRSDFEYSIKTDENGNFSGFSDGSEKWHSDLVRESAEHNIKVLPILPVTCDFFEQDKDGGFNTSEEFLSYYYDYGKWIAEKYKGEISWFEIGNEINYYFKPASPDSKIICLADKRALVNGDTVYTEPGVWNKIAKKADVNLSVNQEYDDKGNVVSSKVSASSKDGTVYYSDLEAYEPESGKDYAKILKAVYDGIKAGNPDALVISSGCSVRNKDDGESTIRNMREFAEGMLGAIQEDAQNNYFDVFGIHSYHTGSAPEKGDQWAMGYDFCEAQDDVTRLLEEYDAIRYSEANGIEKNVEKWTTEIGLSATMAKEREYSAWHLRLLALNLMGDKYGPYHNKYFIYSIFNHGFDENNSEDYYGIVDCWKDKDAYTKSAYSAKEPYLAIAQWNRMMNGARFVDADIKRVSDSHNYDSAGDEILTQGNYVLNYDCNGDRVALVWDVVQPTEVTLNDDFSHIMVYDMFGNVISEKDGTSITVTATDEPVYVKFENPQLKITDMQLTKDTYGTVLNDKNSISAGDDVFVKVSYKNTLSKDKTFTVIGAVYNKERMTAVELKTVTAGANSENTEYIKIKIEDLEELTIKGIVVESIDNMKPLKGAFNNNL